MWLRARDGLRARFMNSEIFEGWEAPSPSTPSTSSTAHTPTSALSTPPLLPLPRLMFREEALALCAHLCPEDLAQLVSVTSWKASGEDREAMWRAYFMLRWGAEHGAARGTQVRVMRSWVDDAWPAPWPLAVGFCGARSALDHLFWFLPFIRCTLHVETPRHTPPPPPPPSSAWQVACRVRARPRGATRLARCFLCDVLEVSPPDPAPQHFRRGWARPCQTCPLLAHRMCLERALLGMATQAGDELKVGKNAYVARKSGPASLLCKQCGVEYRTSRRFPETLAELLRATAQEWRWVVRRLVVCLLFFVWMYTLAEHYCALNGISKELCILLAFTASMMSISVSQRFHRGIQMIWNTPHRWRYFQLFALFALLFYMVSLRALDPALWKAAATQQPWLAGLHEVHSVIHGSFVGALVLSSISLLYMGTASGVIFLFWKTSLRVPTVADAELPTLTDSLQHTGISQQTAPCGLCQLGLCLDNTCM